ncbi:peroxisomal membrane protein PEX14-like isoform X3 [Mytilus californianus]|uniref:peroxisomal membrane protein PEX14-like isoform X3 n=3 Tax=Mytilus californianus TaxID=6549 RepID=UPI002245115A|nr:peroxisomal membrane protein PEX14-like isoform X3 [Mytilus californianus]
MIKRENFLERKGMIKRENFLERKGMIKRENFLERKGMIKRENFLERKGMIKRENFLERKGMIKRENFLERKGMIKRENFLERKGLTKEEIELAIERSGVPSDKPTQVYPPQPPGIQAPIPGAVVPYQQSAPPVGTLVKIRDVLHTIALIGGLSYAAFKFFKEYLLPWILGKPKTEDRLDKIENMVIELQKNIVETLSKIQLTLTSMQETMSTNQEKVQAISHEVYSQRSSTAMSNINESQFATEMKSELQTVKGLLLNRRQFPPTPSSSSLPAWQLSQTATPTNKSNMVKPSGDATPVSEPSGDVAIVSEPSGDAIVSEEAYLNQNKNDRTDAENNEEVKVNFSFEETTNVDMSDVSQPIKTEASDILNQSEDNLQMKSKGENDNEEEVD